MASNYTDLQAEILAYLDNNNPNLVAAVPTLIEHAERTFQRILRTLETECRASHDIRPVGTPDADLGVYAVPADWSGHKTVEVDQANAKVIALYFRKIPVLSGTNATNWLLDKHADIYLYASLAGAESWLKNDPRIQMWAAQASDIIKQIEQDDMHARHGGGPLRSRVGLQRWYHGDNSARNTGTGNGRYEFLSPYDFFDLEASGNTTAYYGLRPGVFTVAEQNIRILDKPGADEAGSAGWTTCP